MKKSAYESVYCVSGISYSSPRFYVKSFIEVERLCPLSQVLVPGTRVAGHSFHPPHHPQEGGQVLTDLHSFSETCPWPCSPAPDSILSSGGPALEENTGE